MATLSLCEKECVLWNLKPLSRIVAQATAIRTGSNLVSIHLKNLTKTFYFDMKADSKGRERFWRPLQTNRSPPATESSIQYLGSVQEASSSLLIGT